MGELEAQIDNFLGQIVRFAENKHEILLGDCESDIKLTSTQEHILMLLKKGPSTNAKIADLLTISPAAVTKALKKLQEMALIASSRDEKDERVIFWHLTEEALPIAKEHAGHHDKTLQAYRRLAEKFSPEEQAVITRFLHDLEREFKQK
ncbi:zinc-dependent MarR family transcriptional regulator [Lactovum odontotermitis]